MGIFDTVILDLVPNSFQLLIDSAHHSRLILLGTVAVKRGESVKLTTGEDFNKLDGILRLLEHESTDLEEDQPIGSMHYFGEIKDDLNYHKAGYQLEVKLPRSRLEPLLKLVSRGRLPSEISITTAGMKYDWQPDGSGKIWDNKNSPDISIKAITVFTPLIGKGPE